MKKILVVGGSTRARRISPCVAGWVAEVGRSAIPHAFELVDLKDWPLPMDDEPGIPAAGDNYESELTRAWSHKVGGADAFVFVTPQYNWGYPAPLKNALDHLYNEWSAKPAMIVTYGGHSGGKCAEQLRQVLEALSMRLVPTMPGFKIRRQLIEANTGMIDPETEFGDHKLNLELAFSELSEGLSG
ncbi:NADPH-dependent FMN reductase [Acidisoma silvae]|uniref:NAD(P)H-dependent oxidoreductase n=1 Tax=Acidisoma silvae TaxID=2802396 RepID=A0A964E0S4_9PROT|nr:NAD(P)H-dependent oxidoreductase [Acidisoma silvae]MCB8877830.1 NAD(P)H-dependent oxidoreductase [Acidisoma silvae]